MVLSCPQNLAPQLCHGPVPSGAERSARPTHSVPGARGVPTLAAAVSVWTALEVSCGSARQDPGIALEQSSGTHWVSHGGCCALQAEGESALSPGPCPDLCSLDAECPRAHRCCTQVCTQVPRVSKSWSQGWHWGLCV